MEIEWTKLLNHCYFNYTYFTFSNVTKRAAILNSFNTSVEKQGHSTPRYIVNVLENLIEICSVVMCDWTADSQIDNQADATSSL